MPKYMRLRQWMAQGNAGWIREELLLNIGCLVACPDEAPPITKDLTCNGGDDGALQEGAKRAQAWLMAFDSLAPLAFCGLRAEKCCWLSWSWTFQ
jgi:hypothetical protein